MQFASTITLDRPFVCGWGGGGGGGAGSIVTFVARLNLFLCVHAHMLTYLCRL